MPRRTKLAVILHADVVGSTALVQIHEAIAHDRMRDAFRQFSDVISSYGGQAREVRGDALGEVIIADDTVTGAGVILAQRLEQLAKHGGVCISGAIREALPLRLGLVCQKLGAQQLKGFDEPVHAYSVSIAKGGQIPAPDPLPIEPISHPSVTQNGRVSIAVLPFHNLSNDPEQEYFADGITEDIITALSRIRQFFVVARNTVFQYKSGSVDIRTMVQDLGVRYVLEGSVRKAGARARIGAQLIECDSGSHVWAEKFDHELEDIFAVQDAITQAVVGNLGPQLSRSEQERALSKPPENLDA